MKITAINHGLDLAKSYGKRGEGVHMSTLYGSYYAALEPKRYAKKQDDAPPKERWGIGMAFEEMLEEGLARRVFNENNKEEVTRPGEFETAHTDDCARPKKLRTKGCGCKCGGGVLYSPDLLIFNGVSRVGEIKLNSMSAKGAPWKLGSTYPCLDAKFDKYFCVAPYTPVLTSDLRYKAIEDVQTGDSLVGFDEYPREGAYRHLRIGKVEAEATIKKPCSRLHLSDGTTVDCSNDHHWFASYLENSTRRWIRTDELIATGERGPRGGQPRSQNAWLSRVVDPSLDSWLSQYDQGWLAGILDGEGSLGQANDHGGIRLTVSQKPGLVLSRIRGLLAEDHYTIFETVQDGCVSLHTTDLKQITRLLGSLRPLRLLQKFQTLQALPGLSSGSAVQVVAREPLGTRWVASRQTETRTFLAKGLASHNTQMRLYCFHLGTPYARLYSFSMREMVYFNEPGIFRAWDVTFTDREMREDWDNVRRHSVQEGLLT